MVLPLLAAGVGLAGVTAFMGDSALEKIGSAAGDAVGGVLVALIPAAIEGVETGYTAVKESMEGREVQVISFITASVLIITSSLFVLAKIRSIGAVRITT